MPKPTKEEQKEIDRLVTKLEKVGYSEELDLAVRKLKGVEATMINEEGASSQVDFLLKCDESPEDVLVLLRKVAEEEEV